MKKMLFIYFKLLITSFFCILVSIQKTYTIFALLNIFMIFLYAKKYSYSNFSRF